MADPKKATGDTKDIYQDIYDTLRWYGDASKGRCPGVRLLPHYQPWIIPKAIDLGCGRGHTVKAIRELGLDCDGIDQVDLGNDMMVGSIMVDLDMSSYNTAICIDVIEHLEDDQVEKLFCNMAKVKRQIFAIHNGKGTEKGTVLHVNRKNFADWDKVVENHFQVLDKIVEHKRQVLYICNQK